ncbi:MAG: DUF2325 domain-containing protein [Blautia sp.]|nr:DUF2325 domain-containing protein [Blautia sp.]
MSVVIIGGNECMERRYAEMCRRYGCRSKIFCKPSADMKNRIGSPDMLILFTHTVSHKLVQSALTGLSQDTRIIRSHTSSLASLQSILQESAV